MKRSIEGNVFHRIEEVNGEKIEHIGFEDDAGLFPKLLESIVPKIGMRKKVKISFELLE